MFRFSSISFSTSVLFEGLASYSQERKGPRYETEGESRNNYHPYGDYLDSLSLGTSYLLESAFVRRKGQSWRQVSEVINRQQCSWDVSICERICAKIHKYSLVNTFSSWTRFSPLKSEKTTPFCIFVSWNFLLFTVFPINRVNVNVVLISSLYAQAICNILKNKWSSAARV